MDKIQRYREFLDSATRSNNDQQVLSVLEKLDKLPVSLDHLQETGIGKTVNGYRKYDDPVGKKAKSIVNKWKGLVQAAIAEEESSQRNCNSPIKESEKLSHENVSNLPSNVSLELNQKKKGGDSRDHSVRKYDEKIGKRHSDSEGDQPPVKKHRENYPQNSGLKSAKAESHYKDDAMSKDASHKKTIESKSSNDVQMKETKSFSHSSKDKTQQQDSHGHVKSSVPLSSNKILGSEVKVSTLSSHKDSLHKKSTAGDKAKEILESSIKRKRLDEKNGENSSKRQQYELSHKLDEEEMSDLEQNCLKNRELSSSLTQVDILGEYSSKKNLREDGASPDDCKSERESSITNSSRVKSSSHKVSSKSTSHHNQSSSKSKFSSDRDLSDKHSSLRDDNHAFKNTSEGSSSSKHLSEKKSHTSSQSRKTDSSVKASAKDISKDLSCKQSSVKRVSHKDVCAIGEDELSGSDFLKFEEPLEKHYIEKTDRKVPFKSSSKDRPVSKSADREIENFPRKDRHEVSLIDGKFDHRSEKKLGDKNQSSGRNKIASSKPETKDSDSFDSSEENNFQLFFEDLSKVDSKSSQRKDDFREGGASKSNESRNKSSKDFQDDRRSSPSSSLSVPRRSHDSRERIGGRQDPVAKKKKLENEANTGQKNQEKQKSDDKFTLQQKDSSKSSGSHGQKSEKSTSHSLKILDKKSETKELSAGRVTFGNDAIDSDLESDDGDGNSGMSFAACLEYKVSTPQKKSATKSSKSSNVRTKDKHCKAEQLGGSILDQSLIDFPLPTEVVLDLEHEDLPLYPSMRQEFQSKMNAAEKTSNTERRYGLKMIYSGRKQATVPVAIHSLFDACIQVLQENVDDITYVGPIPADILMPVLKVCSVVQLERLEFYNAHFVGETEELWKIHCNRDFRGIEREDMESWRELHMRLQDARNKRLAKISKNVMANKMQADKKVSRVQLTYVEKKPGKGHSSKNNFFGGSGSTPAMEETCQPRSKQEILDSLKDQISKPPQRRRGGWGAVKPEQKSNVAKPAAPLMQKTLQFFKKLRR